MDGTTTGSGVPQTESKGSLLERDEELQSLDRLLQDASHQQAALALIEGQAGIGKSALLAELRERAPGEGLQVLAARGGELEQEFAFGVVRQLFEPLLADPAEADRLMSGAAAAARPVFDPTAERSDDESGVFASLHGLYWLALNIAAEKPLLLSVDDLHWVDSASLQFIAYLVRRLEGQPVLVAATLRSAEPGTDPTLLAELSGDPSTVAIHPGPLSEAAGAEMVKAKLGADFPRYKILGACNPPLALKALTAENQVGVLLPCNVVVQEHKDGRVEVSAMDPVGAMEMIGNPTLTEIARDVKGRLERVLAKLA